MRNFLTDKFPTANSIPAPYRWVGPLHQRTYLLDGALHEWDGPVAPVFSPIHVRDGERVQPVELGSYPLFTAAQAQQALAAASRAYQHGQGAWPRMSLPERIARVEVLAQRLRTQQTALVKLLLWEIAMPLAEAEGEVTRTLAYMEASIQQLKVMDREESRPFLAEQQVAQVRRVPLGVVLCMGPFNHPLSETFRLLIPALLMGNTVVLKPSRHGTLIFQPLLAAFRQAFPPGVVNTVYGRGEQVVPPLLESGLVDVLALVGASALADRLKKLHPTVNRLRAVLSLDAKNVGIVLDDAPLDLVVNECLHGAFDFNGQQATALKILFVHRDRVTQLIQRLTTRVAQLKIGMPWEPGVCLTPLAEPRKPAYLEACLEDALAKGAAVINPHGGTCHYSLFYPALVYPVNDRMQLYHNDQFGPLLPIVAYDELDEPVKYIQQSSYGQQVSLFGSNPQALALLLDQLVYQVSRVNLNGRSRREPDSLPFTGRKDSAEGSLSIPDALEAFSIPAVVTAPQGPHNQQLVQHILYGHMSRFLSTDFAF